MRLVLRPPFRRFALVFTAALALTGFAAGSSRLTGDPGSRLGSRPGARPGEAVPVRFSVDDPVVVVFVVVWGSSNACGHGDSSLSPTPPPGTAWMWHAEDPNAPDPVPLEDPAPCHLNSNGGVVYAHTGSAWPAFANAYHGGTDHLLFVGSAARGATFLHFGNHQWDPDAPGNNQYDAALGVVSATMDEAEAYFGQDPLDGADTTVVFGGVVWWQGNDLARTFGDGFWNGDWETIREAYRGLLQAYADDVRDGSDPRFRDGRFYFLNSGIRKTLNYLTDDLDRQRIDYAIDMEADVCAEFAFCSFATASVFVYESWYACDGVPACEEVWYQAGNDFHFEQYGLNAAGDSMGTVAAAHALADPATGPFPWELAVEVPDSLEWCRRADAPCGFGEAVPEIRLDVYDDTGGPTPIYTTTIAPTPANPDWRADFDGDDPGADWRPAWASLSTEFLTLELVAETASGADTLARYAYVPTHLAYGAGQTGFFRPAGDADRAAAYLEVWADTTAASPGVGRVRARSGPVAGGGRAGPFFEAALADDGPYVLPYDHAAYAAACATGGLAACPQAAADFFLARLPATDPLPDDTERRFVFTDEADVVIPPAWGPLAWEVDGLVLAFPQGRRLHVEADLTVSGAVLTEAEAGMTWGGVAVYEPGSLALDGVTVTAAEVGIEVNATGNVFDDVLLDGNGVGILTGYACVRGGECLPARSDFRLSASCVTGSDVLIGDGYGIWARHADALVWSSTVKDNDAYGLFLDDADVTPYLLRLTDNGGGSTLFPHGANVLAGGDLSLTILYSDPPSGENLIESNAGTQLHVDENGYATVGLASGGVPRNHLARGSASGLIIDNATGNDTLQAVATYWGTGGAPPSGSIQGPVNTALPLTTSPSGAAGHPDACASAGAAGGTSLLRGPSLLRGGGAPDPAPRVIDPEAAAWFAARVDSLRAALTEDDDDAGLARALYATQRLDRADDLGEHEATMGLLAALRGRLTGGGPLTAAERAASEAALVAAVHDALRAVRLDEAHALLSPFVSGSSPLPEVEGAGARHALALSLAALDEADGEVASAIARIEAVLAELGGSAGGGAGGGSGFGGGEDPPLVRDLEATAALLMRRLGGAGAGGREGGPPAVRAGASGLPAAYALGLPYPNPTTGLTAVPFALPEEARVEVSVYDLLGRRVAVLADGAYEAGRHVAALDGRGLASGVYVVRAVMAAEGSAGSSTRSFTRRVTLIR